MPNNTRMARSGLAAVKTLSRKHDTKLFMLLELATDAMTVWESYQHLRNLASAALDYTVTVPSDDAIYGAVHHWLLDRLPPARRRNITGTTSRSPGRRDDDLVGEDSPEGEAPAGQLHGLLDHGRRVTVAIDGHRVRAEVIVDRELDWVSGQTTAVRADSERITFTARTAAGRDAVLALLADMADQTFVRNPSRVFAADAWGHWMHMNAPLRPLETVILRRGQREDLLEDLRAFLRSEDTYARVGLPWHHGYVFHGPPGTGKTSLARTLAGACGMDVYLLALADLRLDASLTQTLSRIPPRSMLVLEDIDVATSAATKREEGSTEGKGVSMSGLLNALDGMTTPHGLVTVMTTNRLDALDPALVRPGRADRVEELGYVDADQFARLASLCTGRPFPLPEGLTPEHGVSPAQVIEAVKHLLDEPEAAEEALLSFVWRLRGSHPADVSRAVERGVATILGLDR